MGKRLLGSLLAIALLPVQGMAAITNANLEEFELSLWKVRTNFHMLTVMTGSDTYASELNKTISQASQALSNLKASAAVKSVSLSWTWKRTGLSTWTLPKATLWQSKVTPMPTSSRT